MGDSTIGTNIVTDGGTEFELIKALLAKLEHFFESRKENEYAQNIKKLSNHMNRGGKLDYKLVKNKYIPEFEQALKDAGIAYILLPNGEGETAIAIRDIDRDAFLDIQQRVFSKSTDYWKELSIQEFAAIVNADPRLKRAKIPVITFEDNAMRLIAAQKFYGNDVVTSYVDGKMVVYPDSVYSKAGDLVDVQLDMAFEQAKGDGIKGHDLLTVRKEQAKYDQNTLTAFCKAYKEGKTMSLWDAGNLSKVGLTINAGGDIEMCKPKPGYMQFAGEESVGRQILVKRGDNISETELFAMLSKPAGNIYNMVCCTNEERNRVLAGEENVVACKRPNYGMRSNEKVIYEDMKHGLKPALDAVKATACERVEASSSKNMFAEFESKESKAKRKEEFIVEILTNRDHPAIHAWLAKDVYLSNPFAEQKGQKTLMTREDKNALLDKIIEHFRNNHENSRDEMQIDYYKGSKLKELFGKEDISPDKAPEREKVPFEPEREQ